MHLALCILHVAFPARALAVRPAELIDPSLQYLSVRFVSLAGDQLRVFDTERRLTTLKSGEYLGLRFTADADSPQPPADAPPRHLLRLTDGQVIAGQMAGVDAEGRLRWTADSLGLITVKLDDVASFSVDSASMLRPPLPTPARDSVELTNGDKLTGFVESIDAEKLTLSVEENPVPLAWDRIARLALANPIRPAAGDWIALADGSRLAVGQIKLDAQTLSAVGPGDRAIQMPADRVRSIDFAGGRRLVPLGETPHTVTDGGVVFGVPMPPVVEGDTASLHAPVTLAFDAPRGATRFAAAASLAQADLDWADCQLIVSDGKGELTRVRLNRAKPSARVNVKLRDDRLVLTLDPGANGPVRDRLRLSDAFVLVEDRQK